eukprot:9194575-Pyramimonas_sp.AAC.2
MEVIDSLPQSERSFGLANWRADREAKQAIEIHPRPSETEVKQLDLTLEKVQRCARLMAEVLPLFPKASHQRPPRRPRPKKVLAVSGLVRWEVQRAPRARM